jgi:hypothetical protein
LTLSFKPTKNRLQSQGEFSSASTTSLDSHAQRIEGRTRQLLRRFDLRLEPEATASKPPRAPPTVDSGQFSASSASWARAQGLAESEDAPLQVGTDRKLRPTFSLN